MRKKKSRNSNKSLKRISAHAFDAIKPNSHCVVPNVFSDNKNEEGKNNEIRFKNTNTSNALTRLDVGFLWHGSNGSDCCCCRCLKTRIIIENDRNDHVSMWYDARVPREEREGEQEIHIPQKWGLFTCHWADVRMCRTCTLNPSLTTCNKDSDASLPTTDICWHNGHICLPLNARVCVRVHRNVKFTKQKSLCATSMWTRTSVCVRALVCRQLYPCDTLMMILISGRGNIMNCIHDDIFEACMRHCKLCYILAAHNPYARL